MFEDATFESQGTIHTRSSNWMLATLLTNSAILLVLVLIPLLYPDTLPRQLRNTLITAPPPAAAAPPYAMRSQMPTQSTPRMIEVPLINAPRTLHIDVAHNDGPPPASGNCCTGNVGISPSNGIPGGDIFREPNSTPAQRVKLGAPVPISKGVAEGLLLTKTIPIYPPIAKAARVQGTVVLQATISKTGSIEGLRVLSGPPMLQQAALDAVKSWRYRPYLLNGEPVEVQTTISVIFSLGD